MALTHQRHNCGFSPVLRDALQPAVLDEEHATLWRYFFTQMKKPPISGRLL
jgi:hypothetical protein